MNDKVLYFHKKPNNEIFYVGIGNKNRPYVKTGRSAWWHNIVNKYGYIIEVIAENLSQEEAIKLEQQYISRFGRLDLGLGLLINLTDGGCGIYNPNQEIRNKIGSAHKGMKHSSDSIEKIRKSHIGKIKTLEHRKNLSISLFGKQKSEAAKINMSLAKKGKPLTEVQKLSNKLNGQKKLGIELPVETKNAMSEAAKKRNTSRGLKISQYPGVTWSKEKNRWRVSIYKNGKANWLGYFYDETEAFLARSKFINQN